MQHDAYILFVAFWIILYMKRVMESSPKSKHENMSFLFTGYKKYRTFDVTFFYVMRLRRYVSVSLTSMTRILSTDLPGFTSLFGRNPASLVSAAVVQQTRFTLHFCRKSTSDSRSMDLSDMRKKYKAAGEASMSQGGKYWLIIKCLVCVNARSWLYKLMWSVCTVLSNLTITLRLQRADISVLCCPDKITLLFDFGLHTYTKVMSEHNLP